MKTIFWVMIIGLVSAACGDNPTPETVDEPDDDDTIDDVHFDVPDDQGPVDGEVVIVPENPVWCLPEAVPYDLGQLPAVPVGFDRANFCDAAGLTRDEAIPTHQHTYDPELDVLEVEGVQLVGPGDARVTYAFDEQGRLRELFRRGSEGWYSVSTGSTWYVLNEDGELDRKLATQFMLAIPEAAEDVIETVQTWDGERLLSREVRSGEDGVAMRRTQWSYDEAGRLVLAEHIDRWNPDDERTYTSTWDYNDAGLPIRVVRRIDGQLVEREAWSFDGTGQLVARTYEAPSLDALAAEHGRDRWAWQFVGGLDSYERPDDDLFVGDPWLAALPISRGDCFQLPRGPGHGYPDAEAEYQLGVPQSERLTGMGFAYGNSGYAWNYGDLAWYGHAGLGSNWYGSPFNWFATDLEVELSYEAGRLVSEDATVSVPGGDPLTITRTRSLVDGQIDSDRVVVSNESGEGTERELLFERDEAGHLTARELVVGGDRVARQTWERDERGRALRHQVEAGQLPPTLSADGWEASIGGFGEGEIIATEYYWRYEGDVLVERGGGENALQETRSYDELGRLVEVLGSLASMDASSSKRWTYDDEGRVVALCTGYDDSVWNCTNTVYDAVGRLAWSESVRGEEAPLLLQYNLYSCAQ